MRIFILALFATILYSCSSESNDELLFRNIYGSTSGITFKNQLAEEEGFDVFRYRNYYNGGGVAIADFNNDQLSDIYFVSNQNSNQLYLNKGNLSFEASGEAQGEKPWSTGVAVADINGDGWQDIYVCNSGDLKGNDRGNELFINNQDGTFTEKAEEYGLNDPGFSTHAVFFDFDHDNDLDCYLLNNSFHPVSSLPIENVRDKRDQSGGGDKFFINDNGKFVDVSDSVGVFGSVVGFGLGITLLDINDDTYTDIYISNDFFERDYLYINKEGKYFTEELEKYFDQISLFSMGADAADLNNDGREEIFVTDMLPEDRVRLKKTTNFETPDLFRLKQSKGFYNQFMKNTLQWDNGDGTFSELGRQLGVSATDWSWGALMFDMDNDGFREIFVANGVYKDVTDQDFIAYFANEENLKSALEGDEISFDKFVDRMPSTPIPNIVYTRDSTDGFSNVATAWGLGTPSFSNGAAYGDLDNDGDLDLVVNNLNQDAFIYENRSDELRGNNFLRISLKGMGKNSFAIGSEVKVYVGESIFSYSHYPVRGFQSSVGYSTTIGLGSSSSIDSLIVQWPNGSSSVLKEVAVNTLMEINMAETETSSPVISNSTSLFTRSTEGPEHNENPYDDFDFNRLVYHGLSKEGPAVAVGDLNGDGRDDIYFGGSMEMPGSVWIQGTDLTFIESKNELFDEYKYSEDVDAAFFDADNDGDLDLYVVTGGVEYSEDRRRYLDHLFINEGQNRGEISWRRSDNTPVNPYSGSVVRPADFDGDGDIDLFLGGRAIPEQYGIAASSYLLENDGSGSFKDVTSKYITQLDNLGMVTDAVWTDYDKDNDLDLVVVGDWMAVTLFENRGNFIQRKFDFPGLENSQGWWKSISAADLNQDGYPELVLGNFGTNSMFKASIDNPVRMYLNDFDQNGSLEHIYTFKSGDKFVPYHVRDALNEQLVELKKRFTTYSDYADQDIEGLFSEEQLLSSTRLDVYQLSSVVAWNKGGAEFSLEELPLEAQSAPVYEILIKDLNEDSKPDIILMGNYSNVKPEEGFYDGNHGVVLIQTDEGWRSLNSQESGIFIRGDVRALRWIKGGTGEALFIGRNDKKAELYTK